MGDMGDLFKAHSAEKKARHMRWKEDNTAALMTSGLVFRVASPETLCFREEGKPAVDFYPSTGRWREVKVNKTHGGHAGAFLKWYAKR